ncbi:AAA family ATPase [Haliangium sp.]|uniref:AAA family ATPase n=1 Tax=Haliangium sp. TaxID=2663208 RepID=UPI003D0A7A05
MSDLQIFPSTRSQGRFEWVLPELVAQDFIQRDLDWRWPPLVFLTGDIARAGQADDYAAADEWLTGLMNALGGDPWVFAVPGNHDFNRDAATSDHDFMAKRLFDDWDDLDSVREAFWRDPASPLRVQVERAFANFARWYVDRWAIPPEAELVRGLLPGDHSVSFEYDGARLGVLGLNTAFVHDSRDAALGQLHREQVNRACGGDLGAWCQRHDGWILLTHHPPEQFGSQSRALLELMKRQHTLLGHFCSGRHTSQPLAGSASSGIISASRGLSFGRRYERTAGYVAGDFDLGTREMATLIPRRYCVDRITFERDDIIHRPAPSPPGRALESGHGDSDEHRLDELPTLVSLEIRNFRCIKELNIPLSLPSELGGQWTCLAGLNGSGKSSVLQALCMGLLGEEFVPELGGTRLARMRRVERGRVLDAEVTVIVGHGDARHRLSIELTDDGVRADVTDAADEIWRRLSRHVLASYGATRNLSYYVDRRHEDLSPALRAQMTLFDPLTQIAHAEVLLDPSNRVTSTHFPRLLTTLLDRVFDGEIRLVRNGHGLSFEIGRDHVPALELPDGFRSALAWLADLCAAWLAKHPPDDDQAPSLEDIEAIVLIDELDLHLHPSLQRTLVSRLRNCLPKIQWVVTTHSPFLLSSFDRHELILLERSAESGVRQLDRQILGFDMNQVYEWLMNTPPRSSVAEDRLAADAQAHERQVARWLETSPVVDDDDADERMARRKELFAKLRDM